MDLVRVAGATINQTPMDWKGNRLRIEALMKGAKDQNVDVLCFPELSISGYGCEDALMSIHTVRSAERVLEQLLPLSEQMVVILGMPWIHRNRLYNVAVVVQDGAVLGVNPKRVLAREGIHYEPRWFQPWPFFATDETRMCGKSVPFGDLRYRLGSFSMAIEICEEAWGGESSCLEHVESGSELIVNPSASHFSVGKMLTRERLVTNWSRALKVHYCYANLLGLEAGRVIYDGGVMIAEAGELVARGKRFGYDDGAITFADLDLDLARGARIRGQSLRDAPPHKITPVVIGSEVMSARSMDRKGILQRGRKQQRQEIERTCGALMGRFDELTHAVCLGLFDYLRKSHQSGYTLSLSGGVDSSICAVMATHALAEALKELGAEQLQLRIPSLQVPKNRREDPSAWIESYLTTVYQHTSQSSQQSQTLADGLAKALGTQHHMIEVQDLVDLYQKKAEDALGLRMDWQQHDLPMQNIQARARSPMVWLLANLQGHLLLSTSNRSEAAVGYVTMDGDSSGSLAPIAGLDKHSLRQLCQWLAEQKNYGLGPVPILAKVAAQAPSAELRPLDAQQEDEKDLMPYQWLRQMEIWFVRDQMSPSDILAAMQVEFPEAEPVALAKAVSDFCRLWRLSQWKRERMAPSFYLDDLSVDPKTFCRYPIFSGDMEVSS